MGILRHPHCAGEGYVGITGRELDLSHPQTLINTHCIVEDAVVRDKWVAHE